jgi:ribonuclease HI
MITLLNEDALWFRRALFVSLSAFETTRHLFLDCPFARHMWCWLASLLDISIDCSEFMTVFASFNPNWTVCFTHIANAAVLHVIHTIWMARNNVRFNNTPVSVHAATTKVLTSVSLSHRLIPGHANAAEHAAIKLLHLEPKPAPPMTVRLVLWKSPSVEWIKANTDGSVTHASAACGGLFRDYTSRFLGGYAQRVNGTVLHAELMSMILAMELAHRQGWLALWIESDSKAALQAFENHQVVPWDLRNRWSNCFSLHLNLRWSHIYREGNACADKLANLGHSFVDLKWWNSMPLELRDTTLHDSLGLPSYRFD